MVQRQGFLTVVIVVELHGEAHVVGEDVQVLQEEEQLPGQEDRCFFGVLHGHLHLRILVAVELKGNPSSQE